MSFMNLKYLSLPRIMVKLGLSFYIYFLTLPSGYHVPAVRRRDRFYAKLEQERAKALGQL